MLTSVRGDQPQHLLAPYPFTLSVATKACVYRTPKSKKCRNKYVTSANAVVSCIPGVGGAPGTLAFNFTAATGGYLLTSTPTVVASCANSKFSDMSTCSMSNPASLAKGVLASATAPSTTLASAEWDSNCVCTATKRRPVMKVDVPQVLCGGACKGG
jgi:hypothetical protein